jgi:hypothetical protein
MKRLTSTKIRLLVPLAALGALVLAGLSYGQATVGTFYNQETFTAIEPEFVCQPATTGVVTNTVTESGHFTITDQGVHFRGTETQDYRIDFADGRYLVTSSPSHFEFTATSGGLEVYTAAQQDRGTLYSAEGQAIGIVSVFTLTHTTWRDTNRNGVPDPGELAANVSLFRVTCP